MLSPLLLRIDVRLAHTNSELGASKIISPGYGLVLLKNVYIPRRYRSSPGLVTHFSGPYDSSLIPAGCGGNTLGPPILALNNPDAFSAISRTISASTRIRDHAYGNPYPARAPTTAVTPAASSEKNHTPLPPSGPRT